MAAVAAEEAVANLSQRTPTRTGAGTVAAKSSAMDDMVVAALQPGPDEPWSARLTTQKGLMRYSVAFNSCTFSDSCFTLKLASVEPSSAQRAP